MSPLTAFLLLSGLVLLCAGFTVGLTFAPCYSALCTEEFFPFTTRVHIAFFYSLLASIAVVLSARTISDTVQRISRAYVLPHVLPVIGKRVSVGGLVLLLWVLSLTLATTGYWYGVEETFWNMRGATVSWTAPMSRIAWTGITGHWCDIMLGLVIIPVSRNSVVGRLFELHIDTLLFAHKVIAYGLLLFATVHGGWYYSFVGAYAGEEEGPRKLAFNIDNPTLSIEESDARRYWPYAVLPSGMLSWILIVVMTVTALPILRRRRYNTFYYAHVICSIFVFIGTCVHASTDFYCLLPGLLLWLIDWTMRISHALRTKAEAEIENAEGGWVRIRTPASVYQGKSVDGEKAMTNPLQSYYINFPSVSRVQLHAFTAAATGTPEQGPIFLLQRSAGKKQKKLDKEWTWKLAALVPNAGSSRALTVRIEGPYTPPVSELFSARHVLCIVGGTGITGALCIANWWLDHRAQSRAGSFRLVWTVRQREMADLDEVRALRERIEAAHDADLVLHVTSENGRIQPRSCMDEFLSASVETHEAKALQSREPSPGKQGAAWVYCSGPEGLLAAAEAACIQTQKKLGRPQRRTAGGKPDIDKFDWYVARWSL